MNFSQSLSAEGLHTVTVNIPSTDSYNFQGTLTLTQNAGSATQGPGGGAGTGVGAPPQVPSQVVVTIQRNGSTIATTQPGAMGFCLLGINCTAGDVMTFILSSSLPQDQQLNAVRLTLATSEGLI